MFDPDIWSSLSGLVSIDRYPKLPCPYCDSNHLAIDRSSIVYRKLSGIAYETYAHKLTPNYIANLKNDNNDLLKMLAQIADIAESSNYEASQFVGFFVCSMCHQSVSSMGIAKVPSNGKGVSILIKAENFNPPVPMFPLMNSTPKSINEELLGSFRYFHFDTGSSGNKLRRAMEKLCKELGFDVGSLHRNIEAMGKDFPQEAKWLSALKLVGNEATHSDGVSEADLLASFEVFQVVLDIFRRKEIEQKASLAVKMLDDRYFRD